MYICSIILWNWRVKNICTCVSNLSWSYTSLWAILYRNLICSKDYMLLIYKSILIIRKLALSVPTWLRTIYSDFFFFFVFCFFRVAPVAYGGPQAKGQIGTVAACLHHSHNITGSEPRCTPQLMATRILNSGIGPTSSRILVRFVNHWATTGTPVYSSFDREYWV